jgi:hypothetical protein
MDKIDHYLDTLPEWQKTNLVLFRKAIHEVNPAITEDWKWNVPVFFLGGKMYFAMSAFKAHTKYNFILNGALVDDPNKLFNNGFDAKNSRSIDLREGETIDIADLKSLIASSIDL